MESLKCLATLADFALVTEYLRRTALKRRPKSYLSEAEHCNGAETGIETGTETGIETEIGTEKNICFWPIFHLCKLSEISIECILNKWALSLWTSKFVWPIDWHGLGVMYITLQCWVYNVESTCRVCLCLSILSFQVLPSIVGHIPAHLMHSLELLHWIFSFISTVLLAATTTAKCDLSGHFWKVTFLFFKFVHLKILASKERERFRISVVNLCQPRNLLNLLNRSNHKVKSFRSFKSDILNHNNLKGFRRSFTQCEFHSLIFVFPMNKLIKLTVSNGQLDHRSSKIRISC